MRDLFSLPFADVYPAYISKVERKGRSIDELDQVILWLTSFTDEEFRDLLRERCTLKDFYERARINPHASLITGSICGVKLAEISDPVMLNIRYLDKLVDELAKGRPLEKILRTGS